MRLVKRQELLELPAGTLFSEFIDKWYFAGLQLKGATLSDGEKNYDFLVRSLDWPEAEGTHEAIDRLDEMYEDSSVSYPTEKHYGREGLYDDEKLYLVYEPADTAALIAALQGNDDCGCCE